jgi:SAM-dependent methyltransferase
MLAEFKKIQDILICPSSGRPLVQAGEIFRPAYNGRTVSKICYFSIQGQPVLIDFDKSVIDQKDILMREGGPILPRRNNRLKNWIRNHLLSPATYQLARQNSERFAQILRENSPQPRLLIIGGGSKGKGTDIFYDDPDIQVIGFDVYASPLTLFLADAHRIPIAADTIDGIWVQYVLEHVLDPWQVVTEIHRVLKQEGIVYAESPFLQQVHEGAYDFVRFTHSGHRWLFRHFSEIKSGTSMGPGVQLLWTLEHTVRGLFRSRTAGRLAKLALFWLQFIEKVIPGSYRVDSASSIYFVGRKAEKPISPKDIVGYYQGAQHF